MTRPMTESTGAGTAARDAAHESPRSGAYVLVADADGRRAAACLDAIKPYPLGLLIARDRDEALGALRDFGAPVLLIVDLLLPPQDGFTVIEAARATGGGRTGILAWSSLRELRELAICRLTGARARVLSGTAGPAVIRSAIDRLLRKDTRAAEASEQVEPASGNGDHEGLMDLATKVRALLMGAGVAVYLRDSPDEPFRSFVTWPREEPIPGLLECLPAALERIIETRAPVAGSDIIGRLPGASGTELEGLGGLVAVPVLGRDEDEVAGMICVFDDQALAISDREAEALRAIGRRGRSGNSPSSAASPRPLGRDAQRGLARSVPTDSRSVGQPTGVLDRQAGSAAFTREMARARREQNPLSALVLGVGMEDGDADGAAVEHAMELFGGMLTRAIRGYDLAIRWSRQELLVVLPGVDESTASRVAERLHAAVRAGQAQRLAIVGGVASLGDEATPESLVTRANRNRLPTRRSDTSLGC